MNKILTVARTEYMIAVTSKAFVVGVIMMPVFMCGAFVVQLLTRDQVDLTARKLAVVDRTGQMFEKLDSAAQQRNEYGIYKSDEDPDAEGDSANRKQVAAKFELERVDSSAANAELEAELSERVKAQELFAFAIIDEDILAPGTPGKVRYHSQTPTYQTQYRWLQRTINELVRQHRLKELEIAPESFAAIASGVEVEERGLVEANSDGTGQETKKLDKIATLAVPFGGIMLMFVMIMSVAPAMLNNVLEEKMQKISEFLVSSLTPFQLMLGKLVGAVWVALTLATIYIAAAIFLANYFDFSDNIPIHLYFWFVFYLFIALTIFGALFSAIGAACSELRDAQSLMTPVMLMVVMPMMCIAPVLDSPSSTFAKLVSLFPPATPMLMFARMALPPGPAAWEIALGTVLSIAFAGFCVYAAGKVFRIGILSQGQTPTFGKLLKWIFTK
ncbi:MAG TPA: hypothetical protein DDW52_21660 [Planctomycetaceae bacterium]|nr:hypothetical protein [Planctomycetaceae bacterium]